VASAGCSCSGAACVAQCAKTPESCSHRAGWLAFIAIGAGGGNVLPPGLLRVVHHPRLRRVVFRGTLGTYEHMRPARLRE
jgi:hypothetical protein